MAKLGPKTILCVLILSLMGLTALGAASFDTEIHHRIINSTDASGPFVSGDKVMLSYQARQGAQVVSLAFEHEEYRKFHTFEKNRHGIFILTTPLPEGLTELKYRLVVDGLWTVDPNASTARDARGILVSSVFVPEGSGMPASGVKRLPDGTVRFVYAGENGSRVALIGDFNRWDPYLTPMEESMVHPGIYAVTLRLPAGSQHYRFVVNGNEITDPANQLATRNGWGEAASPLP